MFKCAKLYFTKNGIGRCSYKASPSYFSRLYVITIAIRTNEPPAVMSSKSELALQAYVEVQIATIK